MAILKNKGMYLEMLLNNWCELLCGTGRGIINKVPVNYDLLEVKNNIISGVIKSNNNCDYIGIYNGQYVEFEAKETEKETFPLANIKPHQLKKLTQVAQCGGIAFVVIYFHQYNRFFAVTITALTTLATKKIPLSWLEENGIEIFMQNLTLNLDRLMQQLTT
jgi:recombination protein U